MQADTPLLDTYRDVVTPEGVSLQLPAAGPVPRALAWLLDLGVRLVVLSLMSMLLALLGRRFGGGLMLIVMFLVQWAYPVVMEALWHGQTVGKRALGLRVVTADGAPIGWVPSITRNLLRVVDMLPFGYAAGLVCCLADRSGRRLGDLAAGTVVVHTDRAQVPGRAPINAVLAPPVVLRPAEQAAVVAFGERAARLSPERQAELADIAQPLTGARGQAGAMRLFGMANWLLGRR